MPHHKSAKKRLRTSQEARLRNRGQRTEFRRALKVAREDNAQIPAALSAADTAAQRGMIHKNKAARLKSRLMKRLNAAKATPSK
jgi:small subunit ribosomal protein S20